MFQICSFIQFLTYAKLYKNNINILNKNYERHLGKIKVFVKAKNRLGIKI